MSHATSPQEQAIRGGVASRFRSHRLSDRTTTPPDGAHSPNDTAHGVNQRSARRVLWIVLTLGTVGLGDLLFAQFIRSGAIFGQHPGKAYALILLQTVFLLAVAALLMRKGLVARLVRLVARVRAEYRFAAGWGAVVAVTAWLVCLLYSAHRLPPFFVLASTLTLVVLGFALVGLPSRADVLKVCFSLAVGLLTFLLAEWAARQVSDSWIPTDADRMYWSNDELLGWAHVPGEQGCFRHQDFSVNVSINSDGLRDDEYTFARVPGKKRMLVLGDSFGWGFGVEHKEVFSEIIEQRHDDWEIINASVSGYGTDQEYLYYRERGRKYQPDVVLLLFCCDNDLLNNAAGEQYWYNKPQFQLVDGAAVLTNSPVPPPSWQQLGGRALHGRSCLLPRPYFLLSHRITRITDCWQRNYFGQGQGAMAPQEPDEESVAAITSSLLLALNDSVKENGGRLVIASIPSKDPATVALLDDCTRSANIPYLPLDEAFARSNGDFVFEHDYHWNTTGHRIAAEAIDEFLLNAGVLD